jgi:hypothetical protein
MNVKLIMYWNIRPGLDQEYFEFVVREWVPATNNLGLRTIAAWFTVYSRHQDQARIMAEAIADDLPTMRRILKSSEWQSLHTRLLEYVEDYRQKVVYVTGDFQI